MDYYYVNTNSQANGDHEVHIESRQFLPSPSNRKLLGYFATCQEAVIEAKKTYSKSNGCYLCSLPCHTT